MFNINIVRESMEEQLNETDQSQKINTGRWQWDPVNRQMTEDTVEHMHDTILDLPSPPEQEENEPIRPVEGTPRVYNEDLQPSSISEINPDLVDQDFVSDFVETQEPQQNIFTNPIDIGDTLLIIYVKEDSELVDYLVTIDNILVDDEIVVVSDENKNTFILII